MYLIIIIICVTIAIICIQEQKNKLIFVHYSRTIQVSQIHWKMNHSLNPVIEFGGALWVPSEFEATLQIIIIMNVNMYYNSKCFICGLCVYYKLLWVAVLIGNDVQCALICENYISVQRYNILRNINVLLIYLFLKYLINWTIVMWTYTVNPWIKASAFY